MNRPTQSSPRRFFQFRLWHVLALITVVAIVIGVYAELERRVARQENAVTLIENFGAKVITEDKGFEWFPQRYRRTVTKVDSTADPFGPSVSTESFALDPTKKFKVRERGVSSATTPHQGDPFSPEYDPQAPAPDSFVTELKPSAKEFFGALGEVDSLTELNLGGAGIRDVHAELFDRNWPLTKLGLSGSALSAKGFEQLTCYTELRELDLS